MEQEKSPSAFTPKCPHLQRTRPSLLRKHPSASANHRLSVRLLRSPMGRDRRGIHVTPDLDGTVGPRRRHDRHVHSIQPTAASR
jgi:hypothetical protein